MSLDPTGQPSLTQELAAYWSHASFETLPADAVHAARRCLLDTLAVGVAGGKTPVVQVVAGAMLAASGGAGGCTLWGRGDMLAPAAAALVNGTAAHALELDDFGGCGHSGAVVIPAVCALAQQRGATGRDVVLAIAAGYDVASRVLEGSGGYRAHNDRGWHSTGTCGSFGAAAGSACLLSLDESRFMHALGIAGTFTGGTWAFLTDGALVKRFHPGKAAETGVSAAQLAEAGLTGPRYVLEAPWGGFFPTYSGGIADPSRTTDALGTQFHVLRSGIKPYACCRTLHAAVDAVLQIVREAGVGSSAIERLVVHGNTQTQRQFGRLEVRNMLEAQFSAPYCLAVAAESGRATLDQFEPLRHTQPRIRRLMESVEFRTDRVMGPDDYPALEVVFRSGVRRRLDIAHATGAPENPLSDGQLLDKAMRMLQPVLGEANAKRFVDVVWNVESCNDFASVCAQCVA